MTTECVRTGLTIGLVLWAGALPTMAAAPVVHPVAPAAAPAADGPLQGLLDQLNQTGEALQRAKEPAEIAAASLRQAAVVTQIIQVIKADERDPWVRHLAGSLSAAAANTPAIDSVAYQRLDALKRELALKMPGSATAAHVAYIEVQTAYMIRLTVPDADVDQAQAYRRQRLGEFVEEFPQAEETPAALEELAQASAVEDAVVRTKYRQIAESHPNQAVAAKARGALRRLELVGQPIDLTLALLNDPTQPFHAARLEGQPVVVYCWSENDERHRRNCQSLNGVWQEFGPKGLALVTVNVNKDLAQAQIASQSLTLPAVQLHAEGGLEGKWAKEMGIVETPTVFLVGKDGNVVTQLLDKGAMKTEIEKALREKR